MEGPTKTILKPGQTAALWGVFFAGWAVWVLPFVFGPIGMLLGWIAYARGERRGRWVILAAFVAMVVGLSFGLLPDKISSN